MTTALRPLLILALLLAPFATQAETHATCTGFIDSVPTIINTQGTWCLRHDLSTAITSGKAIEANTNNVTIDCNGFKVGGLSAGPLSLAIGIGSFDRNNITVRNCNVRGFFTGISLLSGSGQLAEDNRLDNNLVYGIDINGDNALVQRNRVFDTGGRTNYGFPVAIHASGDIIDNVISGVFGDAADNSPEGITNLGSGNTIRGNRVSGLLTSGAGTARGIFVVSGNTRVEGNHVTSDSAIAGIGIYGSGAATFCVDNSVSNYLTAFYQCEQSVGNLSLP